MIASQLSASRISLIGPLVPTRTPNGQQNEAVVPNGSGQWDHIIAELMRIRQLGDDWDGQGASAPAPANVERTIEWLNQMRHNSQAVPPSQTVPGVNGEVLLVWQSDGFFLEAEISDPNHVEWMLAVADQSTKHWVTDATIPFFVGLAQ